MSHYGLSRFINDMDFFVEKYPDDQHQLVQAGCSSLRKLMSNPDFLNPDFVTAVTHGEDEGRVYTSPEHGYYIQFFAWPAGCKSPVHNHNTWGLMGVMHNCLRVTEYDLAFHAADRFEVKDRQCFDAHAGAIVYLTSPDNEIHCVQNSSDEMSYSLHIYGQEMTNTSQFDLLTGEVCTA